MTRTIANNIQRSRQCYLSKTENKEGYQRKVLDEEINLLDDSEDENEGGATIADSGEQGGGGASA